MTQVNSPFLIKKLRPRDAVKAVLGDEFNTYLDQAERFWEQIYRRSGGSIDSVTSIEQLISANEIEISTLRAQLADAYELIAELQSDAPTSPTEKEFNEIDVSGSHAAADLEEINATQGAVITLPTSGEVKINVLDESGILINFSGSQTIFGESSLLVESKGSVTFKYLPKSDQWVFE